MVGIGTSPALGFRTEKAGAGCRERLFLASGDKCDETALGY
jgi:hypothetical protein